MGDLAFRSVQLLIHADGADGSTSVADTSPNAWSMVCNGNAAISTAQSKFGGSSLAFDGSGDWLQITGGSIPTALTLDAVDGCFELWVYRTSASIGTLLTTRTDSGSNIGYNFWISAAGFISTTVAGATITAASNAVPLNAWTHVAFTKYGNTWAGYVNGLQAFTSNAPSNSPGVPNGVGVRLGADNTGANSFNGYMDEIRFSRAYARYPAEFAVPTAPFSDVLDLSPYCRTFANRAAVGLPPGTTAFMPNLSTRKWRDMEWGGKGVISGTVKTKGTPDAPVHRKVRLFQERSGILVRETWSDAVSGNYSFPYIDERKTYTVVAYDYSQSFRAVIADNITPDLMP